MSSDDGDDDALGLQTQDLCDEHVGPDTICGEELADKFVVVSLTADIFLLFVKFV